MRILAPSSSIASLDAVAGDATMATEWSRLMKILDFLSVLALLLKS